jgi:hypothetical protein
MRKVILLAGILALAAAGCGNSTTLNTAPLTDEEKQKIKEEDRRIDDEERSGSGTKVPRKK